LQSPLTKTPSAFRDQALNTSFALALLAPNVLFRD
jgi:hypothetical protein